MVIKKFTEVMEISGVPVYAHWSLLLIGALILIGAIERPAETIAAWASFFGVILIHECGHMVVAQRKGYQVLSIKLYPIFGFVCFQEPWSRLDSALIAWGGVVAQAVVAVPLVVFVTIFGFTRYDAVNVAIGVVGYYSLIVAAFNLIPVPPLDGAKTWYLIPELITRIRRKPRTPARKVGWRGW
jgi:membrane-associated protease RseP (regulator of RpoE activity)